MLRPYRITSEGIKDLERIWQYTLENWSLEQADRYYTLIIKEIEYLSHNFFSGKSADHIRKGYRSSIVKSHLIFYRKADDGIMEVIRILHHSMEVKKHLK